MVNHNAKLIYGVCLTNEQVKSLEADPDYFDSISDYVHRMNYYDSESETIIGIYKDGASAGIAEEISLDEMSVEAISPVLDILDKLDIDTEPTYYICCIIS